MIDEIYLRNLTSPQVGEAAKEGAILLLPLGQTEEHGQHLAIGTDSIIAECVSEEVARRMKGKVPVLIAPSIQFGYSNEVVRKWPGTFVVRPQVMIDLLVDVCCSAVKSGFKKVALVSGHGHHDGICKVAARQVFDEVGVGIVFTQPHAFAKDIIAKVRKSAPGGMCHACEYETSLLMHYGYPVDLSKATKDDIIRFKSDFVANDGFGGSKGGSVFWSTWGLQVSKSGAYGDPTVATKETGAALMEGIVSEFCRFLEEFYAWQGPVMPPN